MTRMTRMMALMALLVPATVHAQGGALLLDGIVLAHLKEHGVSGVVQSVHGQCGRWRGAVVDHRHAVARGRKLDLGHE